MEASQRSEKLRAKARTGMLAGTLILVSGCASLPEDGGAGDVHALLSDRGVAPTRADSDPRALVRELIAEPLTADRATQIALLNNPRIRAEYARLGISAAEVYDAGRLSNPGFHAGMMRSDEEGSLSLLTFGLSQSFTDLLLLPARSRLAEADFERAKQETGAAILELANGTQAAYYNLVGARQIAAMRSRVARAAKASAEFAQRLHDAGNLSPLELAHEQAAASHARLDAMQADAESIAARNALNRLMGLRAGDGRWQVNERLPVPLAEEESEGDLYKLAWANRLDFAARRLAVAALADELGIERRTRFVGDIELELETERETDGSRLRGGGLSLELPIFNSGAGRIAHASARLLEAEAELDELALSIGNDVQLARAMVLAARDRAHQYRTALIPQTEAVVRGMQEGVNFMLKGQFELLVAKQQEYDAYQGYLEAVRDYWLARTELSLAVGTRLPGQPRDDSETVGPPALPDAPAKMDHMHHMNHTNHNGGTP